MIDVVLAPFIFIYWLTIIILLSPYYFFMGIFHIFSLLFGSNKEKTKEQKPLKKEKIIIKPDDIKDVSVDIIEPLEIKSITPSNINTISEAITSASVHTVIEPEEDGLKAKAKENIELLKKQKEDKQQQEKEEKLRKIEEEKRLLEEGRIRAIQAKEAEKQRKRREHKKSIRESFGNWYNNLFFVKNKRNQLEMKKEILLTEFNNKSEERGEKNTVYSYLAKNSSGVLEKGIFEALSRIDVQSFLMSEGYEVYEVKPIKSTFLLGRTSFKFKKAPLIFYLTQLSAYLKSGMALTDSIKIIADQCKKAEEKKAWKAIVYDLTMGESFSTAMEKRGKAFPKLLINMIKTAEMTGDLTSVLDDMVSYFEETEKTRKQMISAMTYPSIIFVFASIVITFILTWVVPQFIDIYKDMDSSLPQITKTVISLSTFLKSNGIIILIIIGVVVFLFTTLFKTSKGFRYIIQYIGMHVPVMGRIIIYNEVTVFTKTFANLINHNIFITDSMDILNKITDNEVYKMLIYNTVSNLARGETISLSFKDQWAFPNVAYQMLITGEKTGRLGDMMLRVSEHYQEQHRAEITRMKAFIEPLLIVFLTVVVGLILLSVVIPMFSMYDIL